MQEPFCFCSLQRVRPSSVREGAGTELHIWGASFPPCSQLQFHIPECFTRILGSWGAEPGFTWQLSPARWKDEEKTTQEIPGREKSVTVGFESQLGSPSSPGSTSPLQEEFQGCSGEPQAGREQLRSTTKELSQEREQRTEPRTKPRTQNTEQNPEHRTENTEQNSEPNPEPRTEPRTELRAPHQEILFLQILTFPERSQG